ncbi:MAG: hypothetical protein GYB42_02370 [Alphaproteobacteria bacterium]|nr:hypothetical protein [Alphaproteobacteria bacterium]
MKYSGMRSLLACGALAMALCLPAAAQAYGQRTENCMSDQIIGDGSADQTVVLTNHCDVEVEWKICLNRTDWGWNAFKRGYIGPKKTKRLYINDLEPGSRYEYVYNWCNLDACPVDIPDC